MVAMVLLLRVRKEITYLEDVTHMDYSESLYN